MIYFVIYIKTVESVWRNVENVNNEKFFRT
jgi:hypothetical protein